MAHGIDIHDLSDEEKPPETRYTAFEVWEYKQLLQASPNPQSWIDLADSYYRAAEFIVENVVNGRCFQDVEGVAAIFLFRHYLELALKGIVLAGRWLVAIDINAKRDQVDNVGRIHGLRVLWDWVLRDAKPKLQQYWDGYDTAFVEKCIAEFDQADQKGFAWRYAGHGSEMYIYDFAALRPAMRHVALVLDGIKTCLIEAFGQNADWEDELRTIAGY